MTFSEKQTDLLVEIINIGIGRSANILNKMVKSRVRLYVPTVEVIHLSKIESQINLIEGGRVSFVSMGFKGDFKGNAVLLFSSPDARKIVDLITDKNYEQLDMDQLRASVLNEVGNIVLNSLIGTLGSLLKCRFRYNIPKFLELESKEIISSQNSGSEFVVIARTHFQIEDHNIGGSFMLFFEVGSLDPFIGKLNEKLAEQGDEI
ncbi:MAG: hypothetical protein ACOYXB_02855 [Bacteroidota bacterium]